MNNGVANTQNTDFPYEVFTGIWTNWSYGKILGSTLTLKQRDANLLIAFVAFLITIVTTHIWKITCFGIHAFLSTRESRDVLHHQRQVLLRNNQGPSKSLISFVRLGLAWNKLTARQSTRRLLPLITLTVVMTMAFTVATGFSSRVAASNEVLLLGSNCAMPLDPIDQGHANQSAYLTEYQPYLANHMVQSEIYATQCYTQTGTSGVGCGMFTKPRLPVAVDTSAPCPFGDLCSTSTSLLLDTGLLDSHTDLGVNAPVNERFSERRVLQCAPLKIGGYSDQFNVSSDRSYTRYYYGSQGEFGTNYTFMAPNDGMYELRLANTSNTGRSKYNIGIWKAEFIDGVLSDTSDFIPIPQLRQSGGDVTVFSLTSYGILFFTKTLDPWYRATRVEGETVVKDVSASYSEGSTKIYGQDQPGSPLACSQKVQYCFHNGGSDNYCTPLGSIGDALADVHREATDPRTRERLDWAIPASQIISSGIESAAKVLEAQILQSRTSLISGMQGPLPDNQWQIDMEHLFGILLAALQKAYVAMATGLPPTYPADWIRRPSTDEESNICQSLRVISNAHVSFSFFGILFILVTGSTIIGISVCLESLAVLFRKVFKLTMPYSRYEWISNGPLQLQRLACVEAGIGGGGGGWCHGDKFVPLTKDVTTNLPPLDLSDKENPRLLVVNEMKGNDGSETETSNSANDDDGLASAPAPASTLDIVLEHDRRPSQSNPEHAGPGRESSSSLYPPPCSNYKSSRPG